MPVELRGCRVLLTGATGGLGCAIARALYAVGAHLTLSGRRTEALEAISDEVAGTAIAADLASLSDVRRLLAEAGRIDVLVANAALPGAGYVVSYTDDEINRVLDVNLRAPIVMARHAAEQMCARGMGHIVFIGSLSGITASEQSAMYSATKFGLRGFALALRQDLQRTGVGVSVILPGFVRHAGMLADTGVKLPPGLRTVTPENVARGVLQAIRHDRAQVSVAPIELRVGAVIGSIAPALSAVAQRSMGGHKMASAITAGHRSTGKR